jgi:hypothetical protein
MEDDLNVAKQEVLRYLEILQVPVPYQDEREKKTCQKLLEKLSPEGLNEAACASYAYWWVSTHHKDKLHESTPNRMALHEIRRHVHGQQGDAKVAFQTLQQALKQRKEMKLPLLRSCFINHTKDSASDAEQKTKWRRMIRQDLQRQPMVVRGYDKKQQSVVYKPTRQAAGVVEEEDAQEAFLVTHLYTVERAIATTEYLSRGARQKITVLFSFQNYVSSNSPPFAYLKQSSVLLQSLYPERLQKLLILEPPFWMRGLYNLLYPFLSYATRDKVQLVSGMKKTDTIIRRLIDPSQAMKEILKDGQLVKPVDLEIYLQQVPNNRLYDDYLRA